MQILRTQPLLDGNPFPAMKRRIKAATVNQFTTSPLSGNPLSLSLVHSYGSQYRLPVQALARAQPLLEAKGSSSRSRAALRSEGFVKRLLAESTSRAST